MNKNLIFSLMMLIVLLNMSVFDRSVFNTSTAYASSRTALVIGNSRYQSAPLKNPANDARDIAALLKKYDFDVRLILNASHREMETAVRSFGKTLRQRRGTGLFYYAGHGIQVKGRNYLVPLKSTIESEGDVEFEAVDAGLILNKMEDAGNGLNIVILDACRNNPFAKSFRSSTPGLARMDAPTGSLVAYATAPGSVAADGEGRNGIYTKHLLKNMRKPGLPIEKVFKNVRAGVLSETNKKQTPWELSSLTGDFYFISDKAEPASVKIEPATAKIEPAAKHEDNEPLDINALLARAESEKARKEKLKREIQLKLAEERQRLEPQLEKYNLLIENYGSKYKDQAWAAICSDFPMLTRGLETGDIMGLKFNAGWIKVEPITGMEFVWVPGGCYQMGCGRWTYDCKDDAKPAHEVCLDGFWMAKYEVTLGEYKKIMGRSPFFYKRGDDYPADSVSWKNAKAFITKLNRMSDINRKSGKRYFLPSGKRYSLPTEAQWEYAARSGGQNQRYSGGSDTGRFAWYESNSGVNTRRKGTKARNGLGIYDMSGNVREWCEDVYDEDAYEKHSRSNPLISSGSDTRVIRGGTFISLPRLLRTTDRSSRSTNTGFSYVGFRVCISKVRQSEP